MQHVVADPTEEGPVPGEAEPLSLRLELALVRAAAGYEEAHIRDLLVRSGELPTQLAQIAARPQVAGVDAVGYDGDPALVQTEDVGHVAAHVVGADDHRVGAVGHPPLDRVDMRLRRILHPALVAT